MRRSWLPAPSPSSTCLVTVSSALAVVPMPGYATYCDTRAFCLSFGDALHAELRRCGVAATTVCPGGVSSEFFAANGPQPVQWAMPRFMWRTPEQVAGEAIDTLTRNKRVLVPGRPMRAMMAGRRLVPRTLQLTAMDRLAQKGTRHSGMVEGGLSQVVPRFEIRHEQPWNGSPQQRASIAEVAYRAPSQQSSADEH